MFEPREEFWSNREAYCLPTLISSDQEDVMLVVGNRSSKELLVKKGTNLGKLVPLPDFVPEEERGERIASVTRDTTDDADADDVPATDEELLEQLRVPWHRLGSAAHRVRERLIGG